MKVKRVFKRIFLFSFLIIFAGCGTINGIVSPSMQCSLLKNGAKIGIGLAGNEFVKAEQLEDHIKHVSNIIKSQLLPKLKGKNSESVSRADVDWVLEILNKELTNDEKLVVQGSIDLLLSWVPSVTIKSSDSVGSQFVTNLICLLEGILDGFASSFSSKEIVTLKFAKKACVCEKK